jgi:hypothetical protein
MGKFNGYLRLFTGDPESEELQQEDVLDQSN